MVFGYLRPAGDLDGDGRGEIVIAGNGDPVANLQIIENQDAVTQVKELRTAVPQEFTLYQNMPNPFNPQTRIRFDLENGGEVSLVIYDVLGRKLRTLAVGVHTAGSHIVVWDGKDDSGRTVGSGQYYYSLRAGNVQETKKLMLLR